MPNRWTASCGRVREKLGCGKPPGSESEGIDTIDVARFTGLRGSDLVLLTWGQWTGRGFEIPSIEKTDEPLWVPAGPELTAVIAEIPKRATVVLSTKTARAWRPTRSPIG